MNAVQCKRLDDRERIDLLDGVQRCVRCGHSAHGSALCDECWMADQLAEVTKLYPGEDVQIGRYTYAEKMGLAREGWFMVRRWGGLSAWVRGAA